MAITSLKTGIVDQVSRIFLNTSHFAEQRDIRDGFGKTIPSVSMIIERHVRMDDQRTEYGRNDVQRALVGLPTTYLATEEWQFDLNGDGSFFAFDRDSQGIEYDGCGWQWIPVVSSPIVERGDPQYRENG